MQKFNINEFDVIFISYDEPNAEENWSELLTVIPWAQRVHGVEGSDAAHKAAARLSSTDRFITVDGDNFVKGDFPNQVIELDDDIDASSAVFSWPSLNIINGLMYGNGGIKCWPKQLVLDMRTHEFAEPGNLRAQVDFCWSLNYIAVDACYSEIRNNASPQQAWRSGFREGVKLSLDQGLKIGNIHDLHKSNLNRLSIWMMVGSDIENGHWAILGARQGCYMANYTNWDYTQVRDFNFLNEYWRNNVSKLSDIQVEIESDKLIADLGRGIDITTMLSPKQSKFFKMFNFNPDRQPKCIKSKEKKYDIIMITYDEINAENNWIALKNRFSNAKRINGITGIHAAHRAAANIANTDMFWVVDGDAQILGDFYFDYVADDLDTVYVWRARNPVNGLEYGYGGVKLLPRLKTLNVGTNNVDMTTSISSKFKPMPSVSNITAFDSDPFSAWRSGFRECCKLSSRIIRGQHNDETASRLDIWCTNKGDAQYGEYTVDGAIAGREYGTANMDNPDMLSNINNFDWLRDKFNERN